MTFGQQDDITAYRNVPQRQLTDQAGIVIHSARYRHWGNTLESSGTGNLTFGYPSIALSAGFGGLMDAATGLLVACPELSEGWAMDSISLAPHCVRCSAGSVAEQ